MIGAFYEPVKDHHFPLPIPESQVVYHNIFPLCQGCPYPRHGLTCHDPDGRGCLRTDMMFVGGGRGDNGEK